ncbi:uncharacterized protein LOC114541069 [Dendronephthya gigantea]|uniref:uncharacterized protein LOC114541069 n=1 Tax=Dendronephthya gigantea TaxID=151771 RepID=UPI00106DA525|nr:uncharacterized protein LOC114541069 [Dendronephthya gigantea]
MSAGERVEKLMDVYPCFKDHIEIIEEARRVLGVESSGDREEFKNQCIGLLADEIEPIIYYGINKGISPPKSPKTNSKILHVLQNLPYIFSAKKQPKKVLDLVYKLKDHEDREAWCSKRSGNVPVLLIERTRCYLIIGKKMVAELDEEKLNEGVLALLASFYLLDFDYPRFHEMGLTFLHQYIFKDMIVPTDIKPSFELVLTDYKNFKSN